MAAMRINVAILFMRWFISVLFHKYQIYGTDDEQESEDVVPMKVVALKQNVGDDGKDGQRDTLLNDLQLDEAEGAAVIDKAQTVGWHLTAILEERNHPRKGDHKV